MNKASLIPTTPGTTPGYWCTWGLQNHLAATGSQSNAFGFSGHSLIAGMLTEENLKKHVFETDFLSSVRKDLYVMYDLGWDVPESVNFDGRNWILGSQEVATDKFPSCTGSPAQRLGKLDEWTRKAGWKGAAIWVPAHAHGEGKEGRKFARSHQMDFFRERMRWSHEAGISYWKVDYGIYGLDEGFRAMLTELAEEVAPGLVLEHARNSGPLNDTECPWDTPNVKNSGLYRQWDDGHVLEKAVNMVRFSTVFRTYDVSATLSIPTTLDRVACLLAEFSGTDCDCLLNCESEPYLGAVLGCALGIMSSPYQNNIFDANDEGCTFMLRQFERGVRWQRIAPAWGVGVNQCVFDGINLTDSWDFRKGSDWVDYLKQRVVLQCAPARVARGISLPDVFSDTDEVPYVIASAHPNGAVAVAALPRVSNDHGRYYPKAHVAVDVIDVGKPIGVFGKYKSLSLRLSKPVKGVDIWAQDLRKDEAVEITAKVTRHGNTLVLQGDLLDELCGCTDHADDAPGIAIFFLPATA